MKYLSKFKLVIAALFISLALFSNSLAQYNPWDCVLEHNVSTLAVDKSGHIYAGGVEGLYRSVDYGDTWAKLFNKRISDICFNSSGHIFVATSNAGIYRSMDSGANWREISYGIGSSIIRSIAASSLDTLFAGTTNYIYMSSDNGDTWRKTSHINVRHNYDIDVNSNDYIFSGSFKNVSRSMDHGKSWTSLFIAKIYSIAFNSKQDIFAGGTRLYYSDDNGDNFKTITTDYYFRAIECNTNAGENQDDFYGVWKHRVYRSTDNGITFIQMNNGIPDTEDPVTEQPAEDLVAIVINKNDQVYVGGHGLYRRDGIVWQKPNIPIINNVKAENDKVTIRWTNPKTSFWEEPIKVDSTKIYRNSIRVGVAMSDESSFIDEDVPPGRHRYAIQSFYSGYGSNIRFHSKLITVWGQEYILKRTGLNIDIIDNNTEGILDTIYCNLPDTVMKVIVHIDEIDHTWDADLDIFLIGPNGIQLELSTDNGGSGDNYYNCTLTDAASHSIISAEAPMTGTWRPEKALSVFNNIPSKGNWILKIIDDTHDEIGILKSWSLELITTTKVTSVESQVENRVPENFIIKQNYPNPFNPSTTIEYSIPTSTNVELNIHDLSGQKIESLMNRYHNPGNYQVTWNGSNFASGIYIYQIRADEYVQSKKMLLIK